MKNIIYGLGHFFWVFLSYFKDVQKDTIALCDADSAKFQRASSLGLPMVTPYQLPGIIAGTSDKCEIYVSTFDHYDEILDMLTRQLKIPPDIIHPSPYIPT